MSSFNLCPGPREQLLQCFIKRSRSTQTYRLYLSLNNALTEDGKFLLAARKCRRPTCTDYIISLDTDDMSKGSNAYAGKLRSNFLGTKFTVFDGQPPHAGAKMTKSYSSRLVNLKQVSPRVPTGNYPVANISYELNVLGSRGPRRMHCIMDAIPAAAVEPGGVAPTQTEFYHHSADFCPSLLFFRSKSNHAERVESFQSGPLSSQREGALVLKNKAPSWSPPKKMAQLGQNMRISSFNSAKWERIFLPWITVIQSPHSKHLQFASVALTPK
ncbi:TUBBY-LIKE F-BOX PROTEIN 3-RELATED [Salix purpurea]|uniref:TUBBY-LIKE F-BOX PROTEIN 3-RELATED n=1 Tax=Salix purpurea TaxID=77065 RepID=A0A9Q0Z318_SALPP|nr:TUBBY-LIKE F-BOX PROTEIN 3-RELATED [Salix purpurea]